MKRYRSVFFQFLSLLSLLTSLTAQLPSSAPEPKTQTIHTGISLVMLDVFTMDSKTGMPLNQLKREDFQVLENGKLVPLETFASGIRYDTRPITLWLVTLCNMLDYSELQSGLFAGKMNFLRPALSHLDKHDMVGVAQWCDNGDSSIHLQPTHDIDQAIVETEKTLQKRPFKNPSCDPMLPNRASACPGERALREMMQEILQNTRESKPERVPAIVFFYGNHSGMPEKAVDEMVDDVLETSGVVFGITDFTVGPSQSHWNRLKERGAIIHYMAAETGGQYFAVPENLYGTALEEILMQLHFRYELGFKPIVIDGKRHTLQVELIGNAKEQYTTARLRYRTEYIATPD